MASRRREEATESHDDTNTTATSSKDHDLLSFSSLLVRRFNGMSTGLTLLGVLLDDRGPHLRVPRGTGNFFQVTIMESKELLEHRYREMNFSDQPLPQTVALKLPVITDNSHSPRSRKLWTCMSKELQILKNEHLSAHSNIVRLFGVCWTTLDTSGDDIMPVLTLETADLGDMDTFLGQSRGISLQKTLALCIDISEGVRALHRAGIIHADIKPRNVLFFEHADLGQVAKLADFGSALILNETESKVLLDQGTPVWQAPECVNAISKADLPQIDVYALGLTLANLITGGGLTENFQRTTDPENQRFEDNFITEIGLLVRAAIEKIGETESWSSSADTGMGPVSSIGINVALMVTFTLMTKPVRVSDMAIVITCLREELRRILYIRLRGNPVDLGWSLNTQETEVWESVSDQDDDVRQGASDSARSMRMVNDMFEKGKSSPMDDIMRGEAFKRAQSTLDKWKNEQAPPPLEEMQLEDSGAVLDADKCFGTLRMLPQSIISHFETQLERVATSPEESNQRRQKAAFQHGIMVLACLQLTGEASGRIWKGVHMLRLSAELGYPEARGVVGWLRSALTSHYSDGHDEDPKIDWLQTGVMCGGRTARRHLQNLDVDAYLDAMDRLEILHAGMTVTSLLSLRLPETIPFGAFDAAKQDRELSAHLVFAFPTTDPRTLISLMNAVMAIKLNVNATNPEGETALHLACRVGNIRLVRLLLDRGADPHRQTSQGCSPLHFLDAFPKHGIQDVADLLGKDKAFVDARAHPEAFPQHHLSIDLHAAGNPSGTPLGWAVALGNLEATKALVKLGADAFDRASRNIRVTRHWPSVIHTSPVVHAARRHQWQMLEVMLPKASSFWRSLTQQRFGVEPCRDMNECLRPIGPWGAVDDSTVLDYCVRYSSDGLLGRLLLHGEAHEVAFRKTFQLLVDHGCSPFRRRKGDLQILRAAVDLGQPFVIRFLMGWMGGCLKPSPKEWITLVLSTILLKDTVMFETLMEFPQIDQAPPLAWKRFFELVTKTDDVTFLESFGSCLDQRLDYAKHVEQALVLGNANVAKWFYQNAHCDVTKLEADRGLSQETTILGRLLHVSKQSVRGFSIVEEFLKLAETELDQLFERVEVYQGQALTALHLASRFPEYDPGSAAAVKTLEVILDKYHDPWHLNYQVIAGPARGFTALHWAVVSCNVDGMQLLLDEDDIDTNLLDHRGHSIMDLALYNLRDQAPAMIRANVAPEAMKSAELNHWQRAVEVQLLLWKRGIQPHLYLGAVCRPEEDDLLIMPAKQTDKVIKLPYSSIPQPIPQHFRDDPLLVKMCELEVGGCFAIGNPFVGSEDKEAFHKRSMVDGSLFLTYVMLRHDGFQANAAEMKDTH